MTIVKDFKLTGHSINDILYTIIPQIRANIIANVANIAINIAITRDIAKHQIVEVSSDTNSASAISEVSELERSFRKRLRLNSTSLPSSPPLTYSPANL